MFLMNAVHIVHGMPSCVPTSDNHQTQASKRRTSHRLRELELVTGRVSGWIPFLSSSCWEVNKCEEERECGLV